MWIEILSCTVSETFCPSPSSQRVWIEISDIFSHSSIIIVALFTEGVDWNTSDIFLPQRLQCRPLHRGCGLKLKMSKRRSASSRVALFTEGVDWNRVSAILCHQQTCRPLHRGCGLKSVCRSYRRNSQSRPLHRGCGLKFIVLPPPFLASVVALFTEGVDWNNTIIFVIDNCYCRPLHRGCGLKWERRQDCSWGEPVALFTEGVDWNFFRIFNDCYFACRPLHRGCGLKYRKKLLSIDPRRRRPLHRGCGLKFLLPIHSL